MGRSPRRVVIVDDSPPIRVLVRRLLETSDAFDVVGEAKDGAEAVELVERLRPDVVLIDSSMPVLPGLDAIPRLREVSPGTQVVMLSGSADKTAEEAVAAGAVGYLEKSFGSVSLADELLNLIEGGE